MTTQDYILYRSGYKYQLASGYRNKILIKPGVDIKTEFIDLDTDGNLLIRSGYACDGPSGPVKDTDENMRAAYEHDATYQLFRMGELDPEIYRELADKQFVITCKVDAIHKNKLVQPFYAIRRWLDYRGLRRFAAFAADPDNKKEIHRAPDKP